ncbi:unnamed protein product [Paramecium primaurelia]|uniref:Transmembrane protein n=1 Tax=Paramecium primaurelia TaxID=5886 RepID=A0A8S1JZU1_PARPR|nr:unnamed protein product [Paramecium primaurelia]
MLVQQTFILIIFMLNLNVMLKLLIQQRIFVLLFVLAVQVKQNVQMNAVLVPIVEVVNIQTLIQLLNSFKSSEQCTQCVNNQFYLTNGICLCNPFILNKEIIAFNAINIVNIAMVIHNIIVLLVQEIIIIEAIIDINVSVCLDIMMMEQIYHVFLFVQKVRIVMMEIITHFMVSLMVNLVVILHLNIKIIQIVLLIPCCICLNGKFYQCKSEFDVYNNDCRSICQVIQSHYSNNAIKNKETVLIVNMNAILSFYIVILEDVLNVMKIKVGTFKLMENVIPFVEMELLPIQVKCVMMEMVTHKMDAINVNFLVINFIILLQILSVQIVKKAIDQYQTNVFHYVMMTYQCILNNVKIIINQLLMVVLIANFNVEFIAKYCICQQCNEESDWQIQKVRTYQSVFQLSLQIMLNQMRYQLFIM